MLPVQGLAWWCTSVLLLPFSRLKLTTRARQSLALGPWARHLRTIRDLRLLMDATFRHLGCVVRSAWQKLWTSTLCA